MNGSNYARPQLLPIRFVHSTTCLFYGKVSVFVTGFTVADYTEAISIFGENSVQHMLSSSYGRDSAYRAM